MTRARFLKTNFVSGELDPLMFTREDVTHYANGAANLTNMRPLLHGGVSRRPGTTYIADLGRAIRLATFFFADSQQYIFAFADTATGTLIYGTTGTLHATLATPWTIAQVAEINWAQALDKMIICHKDHPMQVITRTGATSFTVAAFAFEVETSTSKVFQPYHKFEATTHTITPSATTGSITVTASAAVFTADYIGTVIRYVGKQISITAFTDTTHVTGTVLETLGATVADEDWDEQVFSVDRGYARCVEFHQSRLWFGGSRDRPDAYWASKTGAFFNFDTGDASADDSIDATLGESTIGNFKDMVSSRHLQMFTDLGEFFVPTSTTEGLTPQNVRTEFQTPFGIGNVPAIPLDGATIFVAKGGRQVREFLFVDGEQAYTAGSVATLSAHLIQTPVDMAVLPSSADHPEQYAFLVMTDGSIAVFHTARSEQIAAWVPWTTEGLFKSVTVADDAAYFYVARTINGASKHYLEKLDFAVTLDSSKTSSGSASLTWTGHNHLDGHAVNAVSGKSHLGTFTIASNTLTLTETVTSVYAGLNYTTLIRPLPISIIFSSNSGGSGFGLIKRITKVTVYTDTSYRFQLDGKSLNAYFAGDDLSQDPPSRTGKHEFRLLGYDHDAQFDVGQEDPLPMTILGFELEVSV
jgi:hypothetical protein